MRTARLDRFGRIVIPKEVRERLGLEAGANFRVDEADEDTIVLRAVRERPALRTKDGVTVFTGRAGGNLTSAVQRHRARWLRRL